MAKRVAGHWSNYSERGYEMAKKKLIKGLWSKSDLNLLKKLFPNNPTAQIAAKLGRPTDAVKKKASRMGLRKTKKYMKSLGRS
jgi:hypothetical protein